MVTVSNCIIQYIIMTSHTHIHTHTLVIVEIFEDILFY